MQVVDDLHLQAGTGICDLRSTRRKHIVGRTGKRGTSIHEAEAGGGGATCRNLGLLTAVSANNSNPTRHLVSGRIEELQGQQTN